MWIRSGAPKRLGPFKVRAVARQSDIAQLSVIEIGKFMTRPGAISPLGDDALDSHPPGSGIFRNSLRLNGLSCRSHVRFSTINDMRLQGRKVARDQDMTR